MIIYEGPSLIDGKPIVCIATLNSKNDKTGPMVQTWIMRSDIEPHLALKTGDDESVCGSCIHRGIYNSVLNIFEKRTCYVTVFRAPLAVYRAYKNGSYDDIKLEAFRGLELRIGAYGEGTAVPFESWKPLIDICKGNTGYSHLWNSPELNIDMEPWKEILMASVDSLEEAELARSQGWRYFRVTNDTQPKVKGETICPASDEAGKKIQCIKCMACHGSKGNSRGIVIEAHGNSATKHFQIIAIAA